MENSHLHIHITIIIIINNNLTTRKKKRIDVKIILCNNQHNATKAVDRAHFEPETFLKTISDKVVNQSLIAP